MFNFQESQATVRKDRTALFTPAELRGNQDCVLNSMDRHSGNSTSPRRGAEESSAIRLPGKSSQSISPGSCAVVTKQDSSRLSPCFPLMVIKSFIESFKLEKNFKTTKPNLLKHRGSHLRSISVNNRYFRVSC